MAVARTVIVAAMAAGLPALLGAAQDPAPGYPPPPGPYRSGSWHPPAAVAAPPGADTVTPSYRRPGMLMPHDAADPAGGDTFGASNLFGGVAPSMPPLAAPDPVTAAPPAAAERELPAARDYAVDAAPWPGRRNASAVGYGSPAPPTYPPALAPSPGSAPATPVTTPRSGNASAAAPFVPRGAPPNAAPPTQPEQGGPLFRPRADRAN